MSRDPMGFVDSYDPWQYVAGDPLNFVDPFGLGRDLLPDSSGGSGNGGTASTSSGSGLTIAKNNGSSGLGNSTPSGKCGRLCQAEKKGWQLVAENGVGASGLLNSNFDREGLPILERCHYNEVLRAEVCGSPTAPTVRVRTEEKQTGDGVCLECRDPMDKVREVEDELAAYDEALIEAGGDAIVWGAGVVEDEFLGSLGGVLLGHVLSTAKKADAWNSFQKRNKGVFQDSTQASKAYQTKKHLDTHGGAPPPGYRGGRTFMNDGRGGGQILPKTDSAGNTITYAEYDINPYTRGVNRGAERLVRGSDGTTYFTGNHYTTFSEIQ